MTLILLLVVSIASLLAAIAARPSGIRRAEKEFHWLEISLEAQAQLRRLDATLPTESPPHIKVHGVSGDLKPENLRIVSKDGDQLTVYLDETILADSPSEPDRATLHLSAPSDRQPPAATPGPVSGLISGLLPGEQGQEWLDEAKDHLVAATEDGGSTKRTQRGLLVALVVSLPAAWYGEVRRRVVRRA